MEAMEDISCNDLIWLLTHEIERWNFYPTFFFNLLLSHFAILFHLVEVKNLKLHFQP